MLSMGFNLSHAVDCSVSHALACSVELRTVRRRLEISHKLNRPCPRTAKVDAQVAYTTCKICINRGYSNFLLNMAFISPSEVENSYIS